MTRRPPRVAPLLLLGALAHAPAHAVERGPHPQLDATGAALVWRGDTPARVLLDGAVTRVVEAPPPGPDGRVVVPLGPLPPATRVHYTVETAGRRIPGRFWTPPAPRAPLHLRRLRRQPRRPPRAPGPRRPHRRGRPRPRPPHRRPRHPRRTR
ncbi:MAG: hypothetical protein H6701_06235 [Myxococcales bacterium]|nr:hypothetical protein [Myxococcales bacterium]